MKHEADVKKEDPTWPLLQVAQRMGDMNLLEMVRQGILPHNALGYCPTYGRVVEMRDTVPYWTDDGRLLCPRCLEPHDPEEMRAGPGMSTMPVTESLIREYKAKQKRQRKHWWGRFFK